MSVNVSALQWSKLDHIADILPVGNHDEPVLSEIRDVLEKHDCLNRFGVSLLHNHFDLDEGEILMETTDLVTRQQLVKPMKLSDIEAAGIEPQSTVIAFDEKGFHQNCGCDPRASGHHHK